MTRNTQHRLYGGPLDGQIVDLAKTKPYGGQLRFAMREEPPSPENWPRLDDVFSGKPIELPAVRQVTYEAVRVSLGKAQFVLWVWSELFP